MVIFNSYVCLPEGTFLDVWSLMAAAWLKFHYVELLMYGFTKGQGF